MLNQIERPLDVLNRLRGKKVIVHLRGQGEEQMEGILHTFDIHINLAIEVQEEDKKYFRFIKGDKIIYVQESP